MDIIAVLARGVPPIGRGYYARSHAMRGPYAFAIVNATRSDYAAVAAQCRSYGQQVWLYMTPEKWHPDNWVASLLEISGKRRAIGCTGFIADAETRWGALAREERRRLLGNFGRALAAEADNCRVGFTSFPDFPDLDALAHAAGDAIFGSPQVYGQDPQNRASVFAGWWARWRALFGPRLLLSFALWPPEDNTRMQSLDGYTEYLSHLPHACGAAGWTTGDPPNYMLAQLPSYEPGGSAAGTILAAFEAGALRPVTAIATAIVVLLVVAIFVVKVRFA